jgi:hypothetical protein
MDSRRCPPEGRRYKEQDQLPDRVFHLLRSPILETIGAAINNSYVPLGCLPSPRAACSINVPRVEFIPPCVSVAVEWRGVVRPVMGCGRAGQFENEIMTVVIPSAARNPLGFRLGTAKNAERDSSGQTQALGMTFGGWAVFGNDSEQEQALDEVDRCCWCAVGR